MSTETALFKDLKERVEKEIFNFENGYSTHISNSTELGKIYGKSFSRICTYLNQIFSKEFLAKRKGYINMPKETFSVIGSIRIEIERFKNNEINHFTPNKVIVSKYGIDENTLNKYLKLYINPADFLLRRKQIRSVKGELNSMYGKKLSQETRAKMSMMRKTSPHPYRGKHLPDEIRQKLSIAMTGKYSKDKNPFWGKKHSDEMIQKLKEIAKERWKVKPHPFLGRHHKEATKLKLHDLKIGKKMPEAAGLHMSLARKGKALSQNHRDSISKSKKGEDNPNWNGGITPFNQIIRGLRQSRQWRIQIFQRDNYTCQICHKKGGYIEADHYPKRYSTIIDGLVKKYGQENLITAALNCGELWDLNNGRTLCFSCHRSKGKRHNVSPKYLDS